VQREFRRRFRHGWRAFAAENPGHAQALNRSARDLIAGIEPGHRLYPELLAEAREYVIAEAFLAAVDAFILELGSRVINKKGKQLHRIMRDRLELAAHLGAQRERIAKFKAAVEFEARLAALEARHVR
jgi:hypothetical protein